MCFEINFNEDFLVLHVKENGLGQTSFSIVPKIGFLPYPLVYFTFSGIIPWILEPCSLTDSIAASLTIKRM
jgi:hypothetical protein